MIDTYVYAIVGVHCKDECTSKNEKIRGCDHPESASGLPEIAAKYCAVCGKAIWVENNTKTCLSDKLKHLQEWHGDKDGVFDESAIAMIYNPMCGPTEFVVGRVLESFDSGNEGAAVPFNTLSDEEYAAAYDQTKAALEPLGLWDEEKFGYMLYAISM